MFFKSNLSGAEYTKSQDVIHTRVLPTAGRDIDAADDVDGAGGGAGSSAGGVDGGP